MHKAFITGTVGSVRINAVNNERDACNVRIVRNGSYLDKQTGQREQTESWLTVSFFKPRGGFDRMRDTTFRVGNVIHVPVTLRERSRDGRTEMIVVGGGPVDILHWAPAKNGGSQGQGAGGQASQGTDNAPAGQRGNPSTGQQQMPNNAGNFNPDGDDFDDDIPF